MRRMAAASWAVQRACQRAERRHCRAGEGMVSERKVVARMVVMIVCKIWRPGGRMFPERWGWVGERERVRAV